jgi:uncharacterized protein (DUF885 family)
MPLPDRRSSAGRDAVPALTTGRRARHPSRPLAASTRLVLAVGFLLVAAGLAGPSPFWAASATPSAEYERVVREFLDWYYAANPVRATRLGIHDHDHRLPDLSREGVAGATAALRQWLERLDRIDRRALEGDAYHDHRILEYAIRAELLELEEVRGWQKNPGTYNAMVASGLASLAMRDFAPIEHRLESIMARARAVPGLLKAARANLREVPRLWAEEAVRNTRGTVAFLQADLPAALSAQRLASVDAGKRQAWDAVREATVREIEAFARWLERDLLPKAEGEFRLGTDLFERKLRYEEHVDLTAEQLRDMNERAIAEYQAWVRRVTAEVDRTRPPAEVMDEITRQHPTARELIPTARRYQEEIRDFIIGHDIVTLPSDEQPIVRETPPYARGGFASMDAPGPFETRDTQAFYNITNVDPRWTPEQQAQHLTYFNYPGLLGITVHESFPGHFVQLMYRPQIPTDVRKVFTTGSLTEGWAHYTEQMMVDEGLGGGDPAVRLAQLRRALQRHARWYAGLAMHAFGESIENATARFQEIAYFAPFPARREVERGTANPTYLYYALGRMQILELRDDYRRCVEARGERFSLRDFHDRFLRLGLPIPLAREVMLQGC